MPFRRRYRPRRLTTRRRRYTRRTARPTGRRRPTALVPRHVYAFKRKMISTPITLAQYGNGYYSFGYNFDLADLPGYTDFTGLFDQFMISYVKMYFVNRSTSLSTFESLNNAAFGMLEGIWAVDYDDNAAPSADSSGMDTLRERQSSRSFCYTPEKRVYSIGFKPAILQNVYRASGDSYTPKFNQWIDCDKPATPHYGLKGVVRLPFSSGSLPYDYAVDVYATYYIKCRGVK